MRFAVLYAKDNIAGKNIVEQFKKIAYAPDIPIIELKKETIFSEDINSEKYPELKNIDFIIFSSSHKSEKKFPSLCLHAPGNWRNADFGGKSGKVCKTSAFVLKYLFENLNKNAELIKDKYNVTLEVTHHGPYIDIPCCFIELGSSEEEWNDLVAARIIAETILTLQDFKKEQYSFIPAVGIGGPHYAPNYNKIQLNSNYAISHIIPSYVAPITETMIKEAEEKTIEQVKEVIIDWKSFNSEDRNKILETIKNLGLNYKKTSEISKE
ncbi:MAG: D-aminoacyl-tRNA deacylase [Candidatus Pacearchaeota archaeon]